MIPFFIFLTTIPKQLAVKVNGLVDLKTKPYVTWEEEVEKE